MLAAAPAKKYTNPEFLLHAVLDSMGARGRETLSLLVRPRLPGESDRHHVIFLFVLLDSQRDEGD
jgi:hypothetical protein